MPADSRLRAIREALQSCLSVLAGDDMTKQSLIDALERGRAALAALGEVERGAEVREIGMTILPGGMSRKQYGLVIPLPKED